jgi:hypothetical protein
MIHRIEYCLTDQIFLFRKRRACIRRLEGIALEISTNAVSGDADSADQALGWSD